jgi:hypothetical protein
LIADPSGSGSETLARTTNFYFNALSYENQDKKILSNSQLSILDEFNQEATGGDNWYRHDATNQKRLLTETRAYPRVEKIARQTPRDAAALAKRGATEMRPAEKVIIMEADNDTLGETSSFFLEVQSQQEAEEEIFGDEYEDWSHCARRMAERPPSPFPFPVVQEISEESDSNDGKLREIVNVPWVEQNLLLCNSFCAIFIRSFTPFSVTYVVFRRNPESDLAFCESRYDNCISSIFAILVLILIHSVKSLKNYYNIHILFLVRQ